MLKIVDVEKLLKHSGSNAGFDEEREKLHELMRNRKRLVCNVFGAQANLMLDEYLRTSSDDIPEAFRNSFKPKKINEIEKSQNGATGADTEKLIPKIGDTETAPTKEAEKVAINEDAKPVISDVKVDEVEKVYRNYMLYADLTSETTQTITAKFAVAHKRFGTALTELRKITATKLTTSDYSFTEKAIIEVKL